MTNKTTIATRTMVRSLAFGILLSMLVMYLLHVFGDWQLQNYRPDAETTSSLILYNKCAVFNQTHILRPNGNVSTLQSGIDRTKLFGSFMNFSDGHHAALIVLAAVIGVLVFLLRRIR